MKNTTLVTGAAGFIGFHLARRLLKEGHEVVGLDNLNDYYDVRLKEARLDQLRPHAHFRFVERDLADGEGMAALFAGEAFGQVVHLAAQAGVRYSLDHPHVYADSNLVGFLNVLEGCRHGGVGHLVYASSSSVYGANTKMPFATSQNVDHPVSLYAATKKANELMAHAYAHLYGLPVTGLRFFTVYGPWGRPDMALYLFAEAMLEGRPIDVYNEGKMKRDFTYVDDVVEGIVRLLDQPPQPDPEWTGEAPDPATSAAPYRVYNIGGNQPVELMRFVEAIEGALGVEAEKNLLPMQPGDVPATYADVDDLAEATGFRPATPLEEGIRRSMAWYERYRAPGGDGQAGAALLNGQGDLPDVRAAGGADAGGAPNGAADEGSDVKGDLLSRIRQKDVAIGIIGLGYVGLPLAVVFAEAGYRVIGFDVDGRKAEAIRGGESYIEDIPSERLRPLVERGLVTATTDFDRLADCDAVSICVPTPLRKTRDPDISYILAASEEIAKRLHAGMLIVLESTTYPGTTTEVILPALQRSRADLEVGRDFFLCFSPERVDPGREDWTTKNTPKVMGGVTPACTEVGSALYGGAMETVVPVSSTEAAEMVKLLENTFRAVNIGLVNEVLLMCDKLGLNAWEVIEAAATKPFGYMKFTPGPGLGGHCIPIDPLYLSWKLKTLNYNARFIELASEVNTSMPRYWAQKVQDALNEAEKAVKGSGVLVLGVAYKKDISDVRESPAIDIIHLLEEMGARVAYHDPYVPSFSHDGLEMTSVEGLEVALAEADCVVVVTDHTAYDWADVHRRAKLVVDARNTTAQASRNEPAPQETSAERPA